MPKVVVNGKDYGEQAVINITSGQYLKFSVEENAGGGVDIDYDLDADNFVGGIGAAISGVGAVTVATQTGVFGQDADNTYTPVATNALALADGVSEATAEQFASLSDLDLAFIYVDSADGDLKVKFSDGTVKTIATDS